MVMARATTEMVLIDVARDKRKVAAARVKTIETLLNEIRALSVRKKAFPTVARSSKEVDARMRAKSARELPDDF
jgi:hypothetical protein